MLVALLAVFAGLEERATAPHLLAADTKVALILIDPFPWLDGALGSERLKKFAGNMPKRGGAVDFEEMRAALAEKREFIPVEIGAGADAEGTASIGKLARFAIADGIDDLEDEDEVVLRRKRAALADWRVALRELRMPGISLYARFRAEATAAGIFTLAKTTLPGLAAEAGKWKAEGDALTLKVSLESFREFGADLFLPGDDAKAQKAVGALFSAPLELRLERNKDALRLTFGPPGKKSGWKPTGATWRDGRFAAYAEWDFRPMMDDFAALRRLQEADKDGKLAAAMRRADPELDLNDLADFQRQLESAGTIGSGALEAIKDELRMSATTVAPTAAENLATTGLAAFLPAAHAVASCDTLYKPHQVLYGWLSQIEGRLSMRSITSEKAEAFLQTYYERMGDLRALLRDGPKQGFEKGGAVALGEGSLKEFEFSGNYGGHEISVRGKGAKFPALAFAGRTKDAASARDWWRKTLRAGLKAAAPDGATPPELRMESADLGLGVPTWVARAEGGSLGAMKFKGDFGDFKPHFAVKGEFAICSTSIGLSKAMLAGEGPKPGPGEIAIFRGSGAGYARFVDCLFGIAPGAKGVEWKPDPGGANELRKILDAFVAISAGFELEYRTLQKDEKWETTGGLKLRTP